MRQFTTGEFVVVALVLLFALSMFCSDRAMTCTRKDCPRCWFVLDSWAHITDIAHDAVQFIGDK